MSLALRRCAAAALGVIAALAGCATAPPPMGREPVESAVTARVDQPLRWVRGAPEDVAVRAAVRELLAGPLTVEAAVQIALLTNPELQMGYERLGIAEAELAQAGLVANPVVGAEARFGEGTEATVDLVQDLLSVLTRPARHALASDTLAAARLELGHTIVNVMADVRVSYYRLVADQQALDLWRQVVSATETAAELAERQVRAGALSRREQAIQQALYAQVVLDLAAAETQLGTDREALNRLLGLWGRDTAWKLPDRLPDRLPELPPLEGLEARAVDRRLDLAAARKSLEAGGRAVALGRSTRLLPSLGLGVQSERDSDGTWRTGPKLEVGLPLFDQGQAQVLGLEAEQRRRARALGGLAVRVRSEVREAWQRLAAAHAAVTHYRAELLPLGQWVVEETQRLYNGALVGVYDLIRSKQDQISTGRAYVAALRDYWVARAELERALGAPLPAPVAR